jgi:hypothetical protein
MYQPHLFSRVLSSVRHKTILNQRDTPFACGLPRLSGASVGKPHGLGQRLLAFSLMVLLLRKGMEKINNKGA